MAYTESDTRSKLIGGKRVKRYFAHYLLTYKDEYFELQKEIYR